MSAGTLYWIRGKIVGSTIYATMWADGGSEPAPQITVTDGTPISTAGRFGIYASINTTATDTIFYDHFTATDTVVAAPSTYPRFIPRALGATIIPVIVSQPLPYIDRGLLSTIIYENRMFIPRALGGVYIPDTVLWVPRALGSTLSLPLNSFSENLSVADPALFTGAALPIDALSATDSVLVQDTALPVDSLSTTDAELATDTDLPLDALTANDLGGNLISWHVDALTVTDNLLGVDSTLPLEALTAVEVDLGIDVYDPVDGLAADDSASTMTSGSSGGVTTTTFSFIDALVVAESVLYSDGQLRLEANSSSESLLQLDGYLPLDS